jgi:hypothetical protein
MSLQLAPDDKPSETFVIHHEATEGPAGTVPEAPRVAADPFPPKPCADVLTPRDDTFTPHLKPGGPKRHIKGRNG